MTDSQKLDLLLEKSADLETDVKNLKRQSMKSTAELKVMDEMILDEVERVHNILNKHTQDATQHIA